jgi:hypothetical protein
MEHSHEEHDEGPVKIRLKYRDVEDEPFDYTDSYYAEAMNHKKNMKDAMKSN